MANSLGFLNKPTAAKSTIGPKPKPASKSPFLDTSDPWRVGGNTLAQTRAPAANSTRTRASTVQTTRSQASPVKATSTRTRASTAGTSAKQTVTRSAKPATTQATTQRVAIPSRGYNYTDASYTGQTPQARAREVDQATMSGQAAGQRRAAQAAAQPQPAPIPVVAPRAPAPMALIRPDALTQTAANAGQLMQQAWGPAVQAGQRAISPAMRALNSWIQTMGGAPGTNYGLPIDVTAPPQYASPDTMPIDVTAPPQYQPKLQAAQQAARGTQSDTWTVGWRPPGSAPAAEQAPVTPATQRSPTGQAAPAAQTPAPQTTTEELFYGWPAPGPIRGDFGLPPSQSFTEIGIRAQLPDTRIAGEDARRQRSTAGWTRDQYRPWDSLTDAEKYQARFGVMPTGPQMVPDYSAANAALARSEAQHDRLLDEFWDRYRNYYSWVESPLWARQPDFPRPGEGPIQEGPSGAAGTAAPVQRSAPLSTQDNQGGVWQPQAESKPIELPPAPDGGIDNARRLQEINPEIFKGTVTVEAAERDIKMVVREILQRWRPDINTAGMSMADMYLLLLSDSTEPSDDQAEQFAYDMDFVKALRGE